MKGPFGRGWTHEFDIRSVRVRNPDTDKRQTIVRWPNGTRTEFEEREDGTLVTPAGWHFTASRPAGKLMLVASDRTTYYFDELGFIDTIDYENNRSLKFYYDATDHHLTRVLNESGSHVSLSYNDQHKVSEALGSNGQRATFSFARGILSRSMDPSGSPTDYAYDVGERLSRVSDGAGRSQLAATYDSRGRISTVTVANLTTKYAYDDVAGTFTTTHANNKESSQQYDAFGQPLTQRDAGGALTKLSVDAQLQVTSAIDPIGRETRYEYSPGGLVTSVQAADGSRTTVQLSFIAGRERPTTITLPSGDHTDISYDPNTGLAKTVTDPTGKKTSLEHDALGRVTSVATASGVVQKTVYAPHGGVQESTLTSVRPDGTVVNATTKITYDSQNRPTEIEDPVHRVTRVEEYDPIGRPLRVRDPEGAVTATTYDSRGNVARVELPLGRTTTRAWDGAGRLVSEIDPLGRLTVFEYRPEHRGQLSSTTKYFTSTVGDAKASKIERGYDSAKRLTSIKDALLGTTVSMSYDAAGQLTSRTNARTKTTRFGYDSQGRLVVTTNPDLTVTRASYYSNGPMHTTTDELKRTTTYEVDAAGRVTAVTLPGGATELTEYDAAGRPVKLINPLGHATETFYDDLGRPFRTKTPDDTVYTTEYDPAGQAVAVVTGGGARWTSTYDGAGRRTSETDPLNKTRTWEYDLAGRVVKATEPDANGPIITSYTYDALDRPLTISRPGEQVTIVYDDPARKATTTIASGGSTLTIVRVYDAGSRLVSETVGTRKTEYSYDANSNVTGVKTNGTAVLELKYDDRDRVTSVKDVRASRTVTLGYDDAGQLIRLTYPSGIKKDIGYGQRGEVETIAYTTALGAPIRALAYSYDAALQLKEKLDSAMGTVPTTYGYDLVGRLKRVAYPDGTSEAFDYDKAGNIKTYTGPAGVEKRVYDAADQLTISSGSRIAWFTYNERGQLTQETVRVGLVNKVRQLQFNSSGRLTAVVDDGQLKAAATYRDGYELHTLATPEDGAVTMQWALGNLLSEYGPTGVEQNSALYLLGLDEPIEIRPTAAGTHETLLTDHLMSAIAAYDDAGAVIRSTEFNAFGTVKAGADPGPIGFHGARQLGKTGLYYLRNRVYSPQLQRFLTRDPIGFEGGENLYAYVANNPVNQRDPTGLIMGWDDALLVMAIGGAIFGGTAYARGGDASEVATYSALGASFGLPAGAAARGVTAAGQSAMAWMYTNPAATATLTGVAGAGAEMLAPGAGGGTVSPLTQGCSRTVQGFRSFDEFKEALGPAGPGMAWHHVVEQNAANIARFGPERIHNLSNLIPLAHGRGTIHTSLISAHYSSIPSYTGRLRVRDWLATRSFEFQSWYGRMIIQKAQSGQPLPR